jgi:hypothetical protein
VACLRHGLGDVCACHSCATATPSVPPPAGRGDGDAPLARARARLRGPAGHASGSLGAGRRRGSCFSCNQLRNLEGRKGAPPVHPIGAAARALGGDRARSPHARCRAGSGIPRSSASTSSSDHCSVRRNGFRRAG